MSGSPNHPALTSSSLAPQPSDITTSALTHPSCVTPALSQVSGPAPRVQRFLGTQLHIEVFGVKPELGTPILSASVSVPGPLVA
jgi:hypothetical protein